MASAFMEKEAKPGEADLARVLGGARSRWDKLRNAIAAEFPPLEEEWVYSGKNYGWSLRLKQKKRAVMYLTPLERSFRVAFALGEKASAAAHESELPASVLKIIETAPRYAEGRAIRMEIKKNADVQIAARIAAIKMTGERVSHA